MTTWQTVNVTIDVETDDDAVSIVTEALLADERIKQVTLERDDVIIYR